jgi:hypothetical protein
VVVSDGSDFHSITAVHALKFLGNTPKPASLLGKNVFNLLFAVSEQ